MLLFMVLRISFVLKQFSPHSLYTCNPPLSTCTEFVIIATFLPLCLSITSPSSLSPTYSLRFLRSCNSHKALGIRFFRGDGRSRVGYCPIAVYKGCGMSQQDSTQKCISLSSDFVKQGCVNSPFSHQRFQIYFVFPDYKFWKKCNCNCLANSGGSFGLQV